MIATGNKRNYSRRVIIESRVLSRIPWTMHTWTHNGKVVSVRMHRLRNCPTDFEEIWYGGHKKTVQEISFGVVPIKYKSYDGGIRENDRDVWPFSIYIQLEKVFLKKIIRIASSTHVVHNVVQVSQAIRSALFWEGVQRYWHIKCVGYLHLYECNIRNKCSRTYIKSKTIKKDECNST
jgi:hypothetical protein